MNTELLGDATWPVLVLVIFEVVFVFLLLSRRRQRGHSDKPLVDDVLRLAARPRGVQRGLP
jgi:hypothetical protein